MDLAWKQVSMDKPHIFSPPQQQMLIGYLLWFLFFLPLFFSHLSLVGKLILIGAIWSR